ncbi:hypothetical protein [Amycolatopsis lexingtonensis]|uniref:hypothetical protein n=1 Tax=Amycolatopsis lexingtonensis TaxID=218822 RepID=UPI003F6F26CA
MTQPSTTGPATGDPASTATTDPAGTQPGDGQPQNGAPATAPAPATQPGTQPQDGLPAAPPKPGPPPAKTFTQADVDRIINERLSRQEKSIGDKLAELFGGKPADGDGAVKPEAVLQQAQQMLDNARTTANNATAEALAQAAGIKPERISTFIGLADLTGVLKDVDQNDATAVKAAIKTAIDAKAAEFPEWKTTTAPPASGGDRSGAQGGKKTYTRAQLEAMSSDELAANADDIVAASREGRITG